MPDVQRIWLVRHGQTEWNAEQRFCGHTDIPLSDYGRAQALCLTSRLQHAPISRIHTSDLVRARETAAIIAGERPIEVIASSAWREIAFGAWEGLTYAEIATAFQHQLGFFTNPERYAPPQGESLKDVLRRVMPAFTAMLHDNYDGGEVVIVSHGGTLRGLLCTLLGMPLHRQWQLRLDPGSLSALDVSLSADDSLLASLALLNAQSDLNYKPTE